jgi:hypothetical protein
MSSGTDSLTIGHGERQAWAPPLGRVDSMWGRFFRSRKRGRDAAAISSEKSENRRRAVERVIVT